MPFQIGETVQGIFIWTVSGIPTAGLSPAPTLNVIRQDGTVLVTGASLTQQAAVGRYVYDYTPSAAGVYELRATTSDATVDFATLSLVIDVGQTWIERIDATISSRASQASVSDPLDNAVPGSYAVNTAGFALGQVARLVSGDVNYQTPLDVDTGVVELYYGATYSASSPYGALQIPNAVAGLDLTASGTTILFATRERSAANGTPPRLQVTAAASVPSIATVTLDEDDTRVVRPGHAPMIYQVIAVRGGILTVAAQGEFRVKDTLAGY